MTMMREQERRWLEEQLRLVTPVQRRILCLRFGLNGEISRTLKQVAHELKIDEQHIREEESKALRHIRRGH